MGAELPAGWQATMIAVIRGAAPPDDGWFAGGPVLTPAMQRATYQRQYRLRLLDALREECAGLTALLTHDGADVDDVLWRYLDAFPSRSFTLNRLADSLSRWLAADGASPAWIEMAELDHAVQSGFDAAPGVSLRAEDLAGFPALRLQPHVRLLRHRYDVYAVRGAALAGEATRSPVEGDFPVVIFRRERWMRHLLLPAPAFRLLALLREGVQVPDGLEVLVAEGADPDALLPELGGWFRLFAERELVERAD